MAGIFGAPASASPIRYNQLQLQTSTLGLPIAVGWGRNRWSTNIIWYNDFQSEPADKGGKGGDKSGSYTYTASVALALGEGPIQGIGKVWADQGYSTLGSLNLGLYTGTPTQNPNGFVESNYPNQAIPYAYTAYLFSALYSLGESASLPNQNFEVSSKFCGSIAGIPDASFADIIPDMITNPQYGLEPGATYIDPVSLAWFDSYQRAQGIFASPYLNRQEKATSILQRWLQLANTWGFWSGLQFKFVPLGDVPLTGNGGTYTPNTTPVLSLGYDDYILNGENTLEFDIIDPWESYNHFEIDFTERSQDYTINPIYWEDQASVDLYGQLQSQTISASEICSYTIGAIIVQLLGKRSCYIRRTAKLKTENLLAAALEPGDIIQINASHLQLDNYPMRVTNVKEAENFQVSLEMEEYPYGVGQAIYVEPQIGSGTGVPNQFDPPPNVNPPAIFEPSLDLTGGIPQLWIGASGAEDWGGAVVYVSPDGTNYVNIGTITTQTNQGTLTAGLPNHSDPDTTDTLSINVTESLATLSTAVTEGTANSFQSLSLVDQELVAYGTVSLTGSFTYALSYLRRGVYNSISSIHYTGDPWWQVNPGALLKYTFPPNYVGDTLYFKLCSINQFGYEQQSLSDVEAYTYTITGSASSIQPPSSINPEVVQYGGAAPIQILASWGASPGPRLAGYNVEFSNDGGTTWPFNQSVGASSLQAYLTTVLADTNYIARVQAVNRAGNVSSWITSTVVNSGSPPITTPAAPTSLAATQVSSTSVTLTWAAPTTSGSQAVTSEVLARSTNSTLYSDSTVIGTLTPPADSYLDAGLTNGDQYEYFLTYYNGSGAGPAADTSITLTANIVTSNGNTVTSNGNTVTAG